MISLDAIDRRILERLQHDGRLSNADLAGKVGLSSQVSAGMYLDFQYGIAVHDDGGQTHSGDLRLKASY